MNILKPTEEQIQIIESNSRNIVVQALAGTGKTTTLVEFTRHHKDKTFLYVAFNKAIVEEAETKFPKNVTVKTVHKIAYQWFCQNYPNKVVAPFIPFAKLESFFKSKNMSPKFPEIKMINNLLKLFYASDLENIEDTVNELGNGFSEEDIKKAKLIFNDLKSKNGVLTITHDFYLKLYHLANVQLDYDYILFDESQDSNDVITGIIVAQKTAKVFVGDKHQAIYQFRGSRDALTGFEKRADDVFYLTHTFRYGDNLAKLASSFLKNYKNESKVICGLSTDTKVNVYNFLDDANTTLEDCSKEIIDAVLENKKLNQTTCFISYKNIGILELIEIISEYNDTHKQNQIRWKLNGDLTKYNFDMIKIIYEIVKQDKLSKQNGIKPLKITYVFKEKFTDSFSDVKTNSNDPFSPKNTLVVPTKIFIEKNSLAQLKDLFSGYKTTTDFCKHMEESKNEKGGDDIFKSYNLSLKLLGLNKPNFIGFVESNQRNELNPELVLTTAHISKGLEWDSVILSDDLFNVIFNPRKSSKLKQLNINIMRKELTLKKEMPPFNGEFHQYPNWIAVEDDYNQQVNLIYVSLTRAKKSIYIPERLIKHLSLPIEVVR